MPHIHEKIDFTVSIYVVESDAVLLRKHSKYNRWFVPGGHIELDEDPNEAALKEVKEETGLDVELVGEVPNVSEGGEYKGLVPPRFMNIHPVSTKEGHFHNDLVYLARATTRKLNPAPDEQQDGLIWVTQKEVEKNEQGFSEVVQHYALTALEEVR